MTMVWWATCSMRACFWRGGARGEKGGEDPPQIHPSPRSPCRGAHPQPLSCAERVGGRCRWANDLDEGIQAHPKFVGDTVLGGSVDLVTGVDPYGGIRTGRIDGLKSTGLRFNEDPALGSSQRCGARGRGRGFCPLDSGESPPALRRLAVPALGLGLDSTSLKLFSNLNYSPIPRFHPAHPQQREDPDLLERVQRRARR